MDKIYKREKTPEDIDIFKILLLEFNIKGRLKYIQSNLHVSSSFYNYTGYYLKEITNER